MIYNEEDLESDLEVAEQIGYLDDSSELSRRTGVVTLKASETSLMYSPSDSGDGPTPYQGWYFWVKRRWLDVLPGDETNSPGSGQQWSDLTTYPTMLTAHFAATACSAALRARRQYFRGVFHGAVGLLLFLLVLILVVL